MEKYDVTIIGGGIHGCGVAQAAAALGYKTIVIEQSAIAGGTSSKSSKLIHGGLRYLESVQFRLVRESLAERNSLINIAPGLVHPRRFLIPIYKNTTRSNLLVTAGLWLYRLLGGFHHYTRFRHLKKSEWNDLAGLSQDGLQTVLQYWDAQTDDEHLTLAVMASAESMGATLRCPARFMGAIRDMSGYRVNYDSSGEHYTHYSRILVNAGGPWVNRVLEKISPEARALPVDLVQGTHIVIDHPAEDYVFYVEAPADQRAVFIMPWQGKTLIGTTESFYSGDPARVQPLLTEIAYLQETVRHYFPDWEINILESFAGLRVLPRASTDAFSRPRDTTLYIDPAHPRLLSIYGGKLTGYRATAIKVLEKLGYALPPAQRYMDTARLPLN